MKELLPLLLVSILVFGGLGAIANPVEKANETQPLNTQVPLIGIEVKGGFLGYKINITVLNPLYNSTLELTITTKALFMILGEELGWLKDYPDFLNVKKMGPVFGFGPARINLEARLRLENGNEYYDSVKVTGLILGPFVFYRAIPNTIPQT